MSGQHVSGGGGQGALPKVTKSSPNSQKQGPMKATIPMTSVVKQPAQIRKGHSPQISPTYCKPRTSSDSELRSPGATIYKGKSKAEVGASGVNTIRRTASLDAIYLKGHWPRGSLPFTGFLLIDKATQTDDHDWVDTRKIHCIAENEDKLEKLVIKQRLQRSNNQQSLVGRSGTSPNNSPVTADHTLTTSSQTNTSFMMPTLFKAIPVNIPIKPLPKQTMRSSVEGLNQEIEKLVLKSSRSDFLYSDKNDENKFCQVTPEGHRCPLPVMYSVDTQTPLANEILDSCNSLSGSVGSSPEHESNKLGTSPRIFMMRGPPDGCEKVHLKSLEERRDLPSGHTAAVAASAPRQQLRTFQLRPSLDSAFQILRPNLHTAADQDLLLVSTQRDLV